MTIGIAPFTHSTTPVDAERGFVLHSYPYKETSLIVELFTANEGRISAVAKGARRPQSALRTVLLPFQPLELSWFGKGELKTLRQAEWVGGIRFPVGEALLCGYYLNELLLALLPKLDPSPVLYAAYTQTLKDLSLATPVGAREAEALLRQFELHMLRELGYGLTLDRVSDQGTPIDPAARYLFRPERGILEFGSPRQMGDCEVGGDTLYWLTGRRLAGRELTQGSLSGQSSQLAEAKQLIRAALLPLLEGRELKSRSLIRDLRRAVPLPSR